MKYVVLLPGDEAAWERATPQERAATYARHEEFSRALAERGHTVTGGAELTHSRETRVVRTGPGGTTVTEGPFAETVEQLTGYYEVESDDLDDLLDCVALLAGPAHRRTGMDGVEVRRVVTDEERGT